MSINSTNTMPKTNVKKHHLDFRKALIDWYHTHQRDLPWRRANTASNTARDYHVWLSEVMLQQTTVQAVIKYFNHFVATWPHLNDLANAPEDSVMQAWAGLGYYSRARNLHKCAKDVQSRFDGSFPETISELRSLPGVGEYTSASIRSIAFNKPSVVIDGNVDRVVTRLHALKDPIRDNKPKIRSLSAPYFLFDKYGDDQPAKDDDGYASDFAQAMMDLGATICTPKAPSCLICPVQSFCKANKENIAATLPTPAKKKQKPIRTGVAYWIERVNDDGEIEIMLEKRPDSGLLASTIGFPSSQWQEISEAPQDNFKTLGQLKERLEPTTDQTEELLSQNAQSKIIRIKHVFTHFELHLFGVKLILEQEAGHESVLGDLCKGQPRWYNESEMYNVGMPSVFNRLRSAFSKG